MVFQQMLRDLAERFPPAHLFGFLPLCETQTQQLDNAVGKHLALKEQFDNLANIQAWTSND